MSDIVLGTWGMLLKHFLGGVYILAGYSREESIGENANNDIKHLLRAKKYGS